MRIVRRVTPALVPALLLAIGFTGPSAAQDPPDRVGRLSYMAGSVSFRPGDVDDWTTATVNYPLKGGDDLWADFGARAEIALGSAAIRLAPSTSLSFLALDDQTTQLSVTQGSLQVRVRDLADDETFEIDTPNGAVSLLQPGSYRVDVDANGDGTTLTVRDGSAEMTAGGSTFSVYDGEAATVYGVDSPSYDIHDPTLPDPWEAWAVTRDRRRDASLSARYVSNDMPGYEDLDDYGDWRQTPEYGAVWSPRRVAAGWAPYRNGHWAWVDPWGWTWVDDAPWGFAPYHYGRWVYMGRGWAWVPGRTMGRPVYAPALVAFVGGSNWSISVGVGGGVGWFPLGPNEIYVPTYRVSDRYVRNINITTVNVTNITLADMANVKYRNRSSPGAVTVVTRETFVSARPVGRSLIVVPRDRLNSAPIVGTAAPFAPTRESVSRLGGQARRPPAVTETRRVVVRTAPPPRPVPFAARERALQAHPGRPLDDATLAGLRGRAPTRENPVVRPATGGGGPPLRPARGGLPEARPEVPSSGQERRRQAAAPRDQGRPVQGDQPIDRQNRGRRTGQMNRPNQPDQTPPPVDRAAPPPIDRAAPPPPPRDTRGRRPADAPPVPALPTPPRLPAEEPAPPARQDRGRRPDRSQPQAEPRPPVVAPAEPPPPPPPAQPSGAERRKTLMQGRPKPEPPPPATPATPAPPAEQPTPPPAQDRGRRPQPEPRPPVTPAEPAAPATPAEPAAPPPRQGRGGRPDSPPPATPAEPATPATPAEPAAPGQRGRGGRPSRGGQDTTNNNPQ